MASDDQKDIVALVVEDHMAMRKIIKTVLQHIGIKLVLEAADGDEAFVLLKQRNIEHEHLYETRIPRQDQTISNARVDLIICDWRMPHVTGLDLLRLVRKTTQLQTLPFVMLTAERDREQIETAIELGVTDYIIKPFTTKTVESKMRKILDNLF